MCSISSHMQALLARKLLFAAIVTMTSRVEAQVRAISRPLVSGLDRASCEANIGEEAVSLVSPYCVSPDDFCSLGISQAALSAALLVAALACLYSAATFSSLLGQLHSFIFSELECDGA